MWNSLAESEARTNLMKILVKEGRGVSELEEFSIGITNKFKSEKFKVKADKNLVTKEKLVVPAMKLKLADEQCHLRELKKTRTEYRRVLEDQLGKNSRQYKTLISQLRQEARTRKQELVAKYKNKNNHLKKKYN